MTRVEGEREEEEVGFTERSQGFWWYYTRSGKDEERRVVVGEGEYFRGRGVKGTEGVYGSLFEGDTPTFSIVKDE